MMLGRIWGGIGRQLANPDGFGGHVIGWLMTWANRAPIERTIAAMAIGPNDIVLDLGCGPGTAVARLARRARHVYGLDRSTTMIAVASRRNRQAIARGRVDLSLGAFDALPYTDRSIDAVLAANVMYFWHDVPSVVRELDRVVRPGGRIAIYITTAATMAGWSFAGADTHRHFDQASVNEALTGAGICQSQLIFSEVRFFGGIKGLIIVVRC